MPLPGITKALLPLLLLPGFVSAQEWGLCNQWPQPELSYPGEDRGEDSATFLNADSAVSDNNERVTLNGNVLVQRPGEQLSADSAIFNKLNSTLTAQGNIRYDTAEFSATGKDIELQLDSDRGRFIDTHYYVFARHARGASGEIRFENADLTILKQASYTTCDPADEDWAMRASTVTLDHAAGMGSAFNARIAFQGVPLLYVPYIRFPISNQRMTGLLPPTWGSTAQGGDEFALPIYLNIHPQLDATITPHNYSKRGLRWDNEYRYLSRFGQGIIYTERLDDKVYGDKRSLYEYSHQGEILPGWQADVRFRRVSDSAYFSDFGNSLSTSSITHLERYIKLNHQDSLGQLKIQVQDYFTVNQSIPNSSRPYRRLPQITYTLNPVEQGPVALALNGEAVRFQRLERLTGKRLHLKPRISLPYEGQGGYIKPALTLDYTRYELDDAYNTLGVNQLSRSVPISSIDSGIFLERDTSFFKTNYLHTLEPRLFYLYVPYRDQSSYPLFDTGLTGFSQAQLFSENRFSGVDRIGDTEQISLSVTSRLIRSEDGHELLRGTAGQIYYLKDRQVGLSGNILDQSSKSDLILEGEFRPSRYLKFKAEVYWDPQYDTTTRRDFRIQFLRDNQRIFNIAYRERGNRVASPDSVSQELDSSILWPVSTHWSIIGRRYHSLRDDRTLEKLAGFEYNDCCWAFRAMRRAIFVNDSSATSAPYGTLRYSWYLQLELKGLASLGKRINELMEEQVLGYSNTR